MVSLFLAVNHDSLSSASLSVVDCVGLGCLRIDLPKKIVPVETLPEIVDLYPEVVADSGVGSGRLDITEVEGAVVALVVVDQTGRDQVEVEDNIWERGRHIVVPVSGAIGNDEALQRKSLSLLVNLDQ